MKIKHITIRNNPILWNIDLDFMKRDWNVSDTIVFVWENGSWKSTLLNIIYNFCNFEGHFLSENESRTFTIELQHPEFWKWEYTIKMDLNINNTNRVNSWLNNVEIYKWEQKIQTPDFTRPQNLRKYMIWVLLDTSINFNTQTINSVTNLDTDSNIERSIRTSTNTAQDTKQLFVDIINKDWLDLTTRVEENEWVVPPKEVQHIRLNRFKKAFNYMFHDEWLEFLGSDSSTLTPIFRKNWWQNILIDNLSSWEKQIAYRWWFLLKDRNSLSDSVILIDEPEISMHPLWQEKILNFYKNLFYYEDQVIVSQIFVTTHSPYLLQSIDNEKDSIFIFPWWEKVDSIKKYIWDRPSLWIINYRAFNLPTIELFNELYWYIRAKTDVRNEGELENYFVEHWIEKEKQRPYRWDFKDCTLRTFIRNKIHHPEIEAAGSLNYTSIEFKESIDWMIEFIERNGL